MQTSFGRRGGPWPGWLRWYNNRDIDRMGLANDYRIWIKWHELFGQGIRRPGQRVADLYGISRSTVHRALIRHGQRIRGEWPPAVTNGFGMSYAQRRAKRLEQVHGPRLTETELDYQPAVADQVDENGDEAW